MVHANRYGQRPECKQNSEQTNGPSPDSALMRSSVTPIDYVTDISPLGCNGSKQYRQMPRAHVSLSYFPSQK